MKAKHTFSLISCPWIWVTTKDFKTEYVGLKTLFENAEDYIEITSESELITWCIHTLILAIVFTSCNRDEYLYEMNTNTFDYKKVKPFILAYLADNADKFDLYDKTHPFLQLPKNNENFMALPKKERLVKVHSIEELNIFDMSDNKQNKWSSDKPSQNDIDAWIARHFITFRLIHCNVNKQFPDIKEHFFSCLRDETSTYIPCFYKGYSLAETIKLNFINTWYDPYDEDTRVRITPDWDCDYSDFDKEKAFNEIEENKKQSKENKEKSIKQITTQIPDYDIARFYTYSNVLINIDRDNLSFMVIYNHPLDKSIFNYKDINLLMNDKPVMHVIKESWTVYSLKWMESLCLNRNFLNSIKGIITLPKIVMPQHRTSIKSVRHRKLMCESILQYLNKRTKGANSKEIDSFIKTISDFKFSEHISIYGEWMRKFIYAEKLADRDKKVREKCEENINFLVELFSQDVENDINNYFYNSIIGDRETIKDNHRISDNNISKEDFYKQCIRKIYNRCEKEKLNLIEKSKNPYKLFDITPVYNTQEKKNHFCFVKEKSMRKNEEKYSTKDAFKLFKLRSNAALNGGFTDTLLMKKYRKRENLSIIDFSNENISMNYAHNKECIDNGVRDALYLWAIYQRNIWRRNPSRFADTFDNNKNNTPRVCGDDPKSEEYFAYKHSLGHLLHLEYVMDNKEKKNDEKNENLIKKYEKKAKNFENLLSFFAHLLDKTECNISINFGKLACLFAEYYENSDINKLCQDIRDGFEISCLKYHNKKQKQLA